jgi:hypothetical protein
MSRHVENEVTDVPDPKPKTKRPLSAILEDLKEYDIPFKKLSVHPTQNPLPHANLPEVLEDPLKCFKQFIRDVDFEEIARNTNINVREHEAGEHWKTTSKPNGRHGKDTNQGEIKLVIVILLYMGVNTVDSTRTEVFLDHRSPGSQT